MIFVLFDSESTSGVDL